MCDVVQALGKPPSYNVCSDLHCTNRSADSQVLRVKELKHDLPLMELVGWPAPLTLLIPDGLFGESWGARHELVAGGGVVLVTSSAVRDDDEFMVKS